MSMSPGGPPGNPSGNPSGSGSLYGYTSPAMSASLLGRSQFNQPFINSGSHASSSAFGDNFTSKMRDRQARGKDPYHSGDGSDDGTPSDRESGPGSRLRLGTGRAEKKDFSRVERQLKAIAFLDNPELLMMHAHSTGESIPATRLYFQQMLCGYDEEEAEHTAPYPTHPHSRRDFQHSAERRRGPLEPRTGSN